MRETILSEIRRVAAEAGGKAPGRRSFEKATGINESTWRAVYWARWGDALVEAGFDANELQPKFDQDTMLTKVAEAFRHFGRVPTLIELRMYGRGRSDFPAHSTLSNHFPTKDGMIDALREFLPNLSNFADVAAMLPERIAAPVASQSKSKAAPEGHVYLIKSGEFYKVGRSDELERRVREIRIALPDKAELIHSIRTDDPPGIEAYWHRRFADKRANGEWFKLSTQDVAAFRKRKFQ